MSTSAYPKFCVIDISDIEALKDFLAVNALVMSESTFIALGRSLPARANFVISSSSAIKTMSRGKFFVVDCFSAVIRPVFSEGFETLFIAVNDDTILRDVAIAHGASTI